MSLTRSCWFLIWWDGWELTFFSKGQNGSSVGLSVSCPYVKSTKNYGFLLFKYSLIAVMGTNKYLISYCHLSQSDSLFKPFYFSVIRDSRTLGTRSILIQNQKMVNVWSGPLGPRTSPLSNSADSTLSWPRSDCIYTVENLNIGWEKYKVSFLIENTGQRKL